ncbi:MAG TPA: dihydrodipicolinate synthase family protein [Gaiellaceae bacterium]|nr:dihydrodipicolinate synthase family protein [Gaiellaceae bacterium]
MSRTIPAALTPLKDGGSALDEHAVEPYLVYLQAGGANGVLALGSTGEGILLSVAERKRVIELYAAGPLPVIAHCGAQTTDDTLELARFAAAIGVAGVAVISPPYYPLDDDSLLAHMAAAADACAPVPFYVYEFEKVSGYAVPVHVVEQLRERAPNLAGLKVSDAPYEKVSPYLLEGLEVFVGAEALIGAGLADGAAGAVSAVASAFPEVVHDAVTSGDSTRAGELRALLDTFPRHAALKAVVKSRGVPLNEDVRRPLRGLTDDERSRLLAAVEAF